MGFVSKLLSFGADKDLKRYWKTVDLINGLEPKYQAMDSEELQDQTRSCASASRRGRPSTTCCPMLCRCA